MVEVQGVASAGTVVNVIPPALDSGRVVVTATHAVAGDVLAPGDVLVEVSGRPIIALLLPFPLYRDLHPGDSGVDVRAIQEGLRALSLYPGTVDGVYGKATADAVKALYRSVSMSPPTAPAEEVAALAEAHTALKDAQDAATLPDVETAPGSLAALRAAVAQAELMAATPLPMEEVQNVGVGGARVVSVLGIGAQPGADSEAVATLLAGPMTASARVPVKDADSFTLGAEVQVVPFTDQAVSARGTVTSVSEFRMADDTSQLPGYDVTLAFDDPAHVPINDGESVFVRPSSAEVPAEDGLAVPLVALRERSEQFYVVIVRGKEVKEVPVETTVNADGYALVNGDLSEGDKVLVSGTP
jgi:hypothetical protein